MTDLRTDDFEPYFRAVHGVDPFPWQSRLLRQVLDRGWPETLDLPTGTGKTAVLDVAVFHLALEATSPGRTAPVRIVLAVDRRTVVDQGLERARRIAGALEACEAPVLRAMRERLAALAGDEVEGGRVLHVAALRGGIVRDDGWARNPAQPLLALSTVDQVGSRLLFRGYGVSRSMRPIHAGLLGNDTLLMLDEVHLSEPFRQTLAAIGERYRKWAERPLPDRWRVVTMSATPRGDAMAPFSLDSADRSHPVLRQRLEASKPVRLIEVRATGDALARIEVFADRLAREAAPPADVPGAAVAVVVNRVQTARLVFERVRRTHGEGIAAYLLTGRMRPFDREQVEAEIRRRVAANRVPRLPEDGRPTVVVSTQCIEAGADLDFDVMVTECASLDALRQRFGRLNRLGVTDRCTGAVLVRTDLVDEDDPIYGTALGETWRFLKARVKGASGEEVDFGIRVLDVSPSELSGVVGQRADAPVLLPAHLDSWVQTSPVSEPDPDVSLWLHGPDRGEPEVQIVWRADIDERLMTEAVNTDAARDLLIERVEVCPPSTGEALNVPVWAARRWLARSSADDIADVEGGRRDEEEEPRVGRPALAWRGDQSVVVNRTKWPIQPGDTLVVPSDYGGLLDGNWAPESNVSVPDIGDPVAYLAGRPPVLRLNDTVWRWNLGASAVTVPDDALTKLPRPRDVDDGDAGDDDLLGEWLERAKHFDLPPWLAGVIDALATRRRRRVVRIEGDMELELPDYYALVARSRGEATSEDDVSSFTGVAVGLRDHLAGVGSFARSFAERCGLPPEVMAALEIAGGWHDIGKVDPRFQRMLHGGSEFRALTAAEPLAKSDLPPSDRRARLEARRRSGYPQGCRHELMSLALLAQSPTPLPPGVDRDLVLYLVSSHHGWCRPFAPVAFDDEPVDIVYDDGMKRWTGRSDHRLGRLDSGVSDRFFALVQRYGWFGLAWLEAILRLADHRRSESEQRREAHA